MLYGMSADTYKARYWRYSKRYEEECPTLDEAVTFLAYGCMDTGACAAADVVSPDGTVVLEGEELFQRMFALLDD
jgi:hypothetical protein